MRGVALGAEAMSCTRLALTRAFTLVEVLITMVILGVLSATVVPQFVGVTREAQAGNLRAQLSQLQRQIELYAARHNRYPSLTGTWIDLVDPDNNPATPDGYIKEPPQNPVWPVASARSSVSESTIGTGSATSAWLFRTDTGQIYASYFDEGSSPPVITDFPNN